MYRTKGGIGSIARVRVRVRVEVRVEVRVRVRPRMRNGRSGWARTSYRKGLGLELGLGLGQWPGGLNLAQG